MSLLSSLSIEPVPFVNSNSNIESIIDLARSNDSIRLPASSPYHGRLPRDENALTIRGPEWAENLRKELSAKLPGHTIDCGATPGGYAVTCTDNNGQVATFTRLKGSSIISPSGDLWDDVLVHDKIILMDGLAQYVRAQLPPPPHFLGRSFTDASIGGSRRRTRRSRRSQRTRRTRRTRRSRRSRRAVVRRV